MKRNQMKTAAIALSLTVVVFVTPDRAFAHGDTMDGPVVKAAQRALKERNADLVLHWVHKPAEAEIKQVFERTLVVRELGEKAKELADQYFFETLVRVHRAGEGAPDTGLKPAGTDLGPAMEAADKALGTGPVELRVLSTGRLEELHCCPELEGLVAESVTLADGSHLTPIKSPAA